MKIDFNTENFLAQSIRTTVRTPVAPRRWRVGAVCLVAIAVLGSLVGRVWYVQRVERAILTAPATPGGGPILTLAPEDVVQAQVQTLATDIPITGILRAQNTALVMARASGTLQNLTVREGDQVSAGQIIARVEPSEYNQRYRQAQLHAQAAQAQVDIAQRQYDNNMALKQDDFVSPTALDISRARLDEARANYRAAQAAAAVAQHSVEGTVLNAPITGTVSRRLTQPGEAVIPEQPVVEIVDLSRLELQVPVSPSNSLEVRAGQTARLTIEGVPGVMTATVTRINPSAEHGHSDVLAYLALPAQLPGLHQGLFAHGVLQTEEKRALTVPLEAVRTDKPQPYVQIVRNGHVHGVPVHMGQIGTVRPAGDNAATPDADQPWIAVRALDGSENGSKTGSEIPGGGNPAAAIGIGPGDWVLSSAVGALAENTGVKLPPSQPPQSRP